MDRRGRDRMVIGFPPHVKSVPITTNCVSSNPTRSEVYSIQHYVIKCVNDATGRWFSDCHIDITEILLKVALNTINYKTTTSYKKKVIFISSYIFVLYLNCCFIIEFCLPLWEYFCLWKWDDQFASCHYPENYYKRCRKRLTIIYFKHAIEEYL
jgi:hypothetical protein